MEDGKNPTGSLKQVEGTGFEGLYGFRQKRDMGWQLGTLKREVGVG